MDTYKLTREIPIDDSYDVLVAGGDIHAHLLVEMDACPLAQDLVLRVGIGDDGGIGEAEARSSADRTFSHLSSPDPVYMLSAREERTVYDRQQGNNGKLAARDSQ